MPFIGQYQIVYLDNWKNWKCLNFPLSFPFQKKPNGEESHISSAYSWTKEYYISTKCTAKCWLHTVSYK